METPRIFIFILEFYLEWKCEMDISSMVVILAKEEVPR